MNEERGGWRGKYFFPQNPTQNLYCSSFSFLVVACQVVGEKPAACNSDVFSCDRHGVGWGLSWGHWTIGGGDLGKVEGGTTVCDSRFVFFLHSAAISVKKKPQMRIFPTVLS